MREPQTDENPVIGFQHNKYKMDSDDTLLILHVRAVMVVVPEYRTEADLSSNVALKIGR